MTTLATYGHLFPGTNDRLDALLAETYEGASGPRASVDLSAVAPARAVHTAPAGIS